MIEIDDLKRAEAMLVDALNIVHRYRLVIEGPAPSSDAATELPNDLISTGTAAQLARCQAGTVRSWCIEFPEQAGAIKLRGRWHVSRRRFIEFILARRRASSAGRCTRY